jgi:hypothetical protein
MCVPRYVVGVHYIFNNNWGCVGGRGEGSVETEQLQNVYGKWIHSLLGEGDPVFKL